MIIKTVISIIVYLFGLWITIGLACYLDGRYGERNNFYSEAPESPMLILLWPIYYPILVLYFLATNKVTGFILEHIFNFGSNMRQRGYNKRKK